MSASFLFSIKLKFFSLGIAGYDFAYMHYNITLSYLIKTIIRVRMQNSEIFKNQGEVSYLLFDLLAGYPDKVRTEICILELFTLEILKNVNKQWNSE